MNLLEFGHEKSAPHTEAWLSESIRSSTHISDNAPLKPSINLYCSNQLLPPTRMTTITASACKPFASRSRGETHLCAWKILACWPVRSTHIQGIRQRLLRQALFLTQTADIITSEQTSGFPARIDKPLLHDR